ncbi:response regulator transcription factor [Hyphococcus luteus]|uniref:DNA-binding response regulator n=1 Tax=Hyphococcus luteus TaxID=2058213 RepID=A0A2S7K1T9_9PROT|nr:response regulator transcription factor [Marinicaulis flavus]PQA86470.1 DNA-binding response regulator [Marinicaulis flavus]
MRVLLIEDNADFASLLAEGLDKRSIASEHAPTLKAAALRLSDNAYDAIILDLGLPDGDGVDWLNSLRDDRPPVLILSARGALPERILGLDSGADDYLVKPAEIDEIAARLRALLRRPGSRDPVILSAGALTFDPVSREVKYEDRPIALGRKETDFLELLMRRAGKVVPRESIEAVLYGLEDAVTPNALEALASRLRRRLAEAGADNSLHTVRGVGYFIKGDPS